MNKLLILSVYPAPYRLQLFQMFRNRYEVDIFFEHQNGDERNQEWFEKGDYHTLDTEKGLEKYRVKIRNIKEYNLVAIYDYASMTAIKLIMLCKLYRIPYVVNCDGVMLLEHTKWYKEILKTFLLRTAAGYLASGKNAKQYFLKYGAKEEKVYLHTFSTLNKEDILAEVVSEEEKRQLRNKLGLPRDGKLVIAVGRFIPLKRYNELIQAWKTMSKEYYLLLIGGGSEQECYEETIRSLQLGNVLIEPFHKKEELLEYYKASDIFAHPTSYDVWGLVINEAMACGLPVVASDTCIAALELVEQGKNGFIVSMGDDTKMCECIRNILKDKEVEHDMAMNSLETIRPYTIEHMAQTHMLFFKEIILKNGENSNKRR